MFFCLLQGSWYLRHQHPSRFPCHEVQGRWEVRFWSFAEVDLMKYMFDLSMYILFTWVISLVKAVPKIWYWRGGVVFFLTCLCFSFVWISMSHPFVDTSYFRSCCQDFKFLDGHGLKLLRAAYRKHTRPNNVLEAMCFSSNSYAMLLHVVQENMNTWRHNGKPT